MDSNGSLYSKQSEIGDVFSQSFSHLFSSSYPNDFDFCLQVMHPCVAEEINQSLLAEFTKEEAKEALFMMKPMGTPRPNGVSEWLYQKH